MEPTQDYLKYLFTYEPETGLFRWRVKHTYKVVIGRVAGGKNADGYIMIGFDKLTFYAHRLAHIYMTGSCPPKVDHDDNVKWNNAWENIRPATTSENAINAKRSSANKSGYKGVSWHRKAKKWVAQITYNRKPLYLGLFSTPEEASARYLEEAQKLHPKFWRAE